MSGAHPGVTESHFVNPVYQAARDGRVDYLSALLPINPDINRQEKHGWTPVAAGKRLILFTLLFSIFIFICIFIIQI